MGTAVIRPSTLARLAKRAPKDAEPELHSLASYLGDMMFVFYAVWRVGLLTVFIAVVLPLFGLWTFYFGGYSLLFGCFDFGVEGERGMGAQKRLSSPVSAQWGSAGLAARVAIAPL